MPFDFNLPTFRVDAGTHSFNGRPFARQMGTWLFLTVGASAPYLVLRNVYPTRLVRENVDPNLYYDISNYLISNFNYIGIALVIAYMPRWLAEVKTTRISPERRNFLNFVRGCTMGAMLLCLAQHAALHQEMVIAPRNFELYNNVLLSSDTAKAFRTQNAIDVLERKYYIFWNLIGIVIGTFISALATNPILERRTLP
jgi:hypothetical protein